MFDKIIVALDIADSYDHLFNKALALAQATGAELKLLSVLTPHYDYGASFRYYPGATGYPLTMEDSFWDTYQREYVNQKEESFRILSDLSSQATNAGVKTEFFQKSGEPGTVICELANAEKADLVIVSSHGRRGLEEFLIGSVSSYVMHRAPCSVMVVHKLPQAEKLLQEVDKVSVA